MIRSETERPLGIYLDNQNLNYIMYEKTMNEWL